MSNSTKTKNRKIGALLLAMVMILSIIIPMQPQVVFAEGEVTGDYNTEKLNNKQVDDSENPIKLVSGDYDAQKNPTACGNLVVHLNDASDTITLYKVADFKWNADDKTYSGLEWVEQVKTWNTDKNKTDELYSSPESMMKTTQDKWDEYYRAMFDIEGDPISNITTLEEEKRLNPVANCSGLACDGSGGESPKTVTTINNLPFGQYAIMAEGGGKKYKVAIANVVPYQTGPENSWVAYYTYESYLKDSEIEITKTINNRNGDTVAIGDIVEFEIESSLPEYKEKDGREWSAYQLSIEDAMSPSFTMLPESLKIYGYNGSNEEVDITDTELFEIETTTAVNPESKLTDNILKIIFKVDKLEEYKTNNGNSGIGSVKIVYNAVVNNSIKIKSELNYNKATINYEKNSDGTILGSKYSTVKAYTYGLNVVKINGSDTANGKKPLAGATFSLYEETDCFVDNVWRGSMALENYPENNSDTNENGVTDRFYLDRLEEYNATLQEADRLDAEDADDVASFKAIYNKYTKAESDPEGTITYSDIYKNGTDDDTYYIYEMTISKANCPEEDYPDGKVDLENGIVIDIPGDESEIKVVRVFKKYTFRDAENNGNDYFVSNGTLAGNIIQGLDANNYILVETQAPATFNDLAEDIYFSIGMLSEDEAKSQFAGSYASFKKSDGSYEESGIQKMEVLNYKGLVLPSTGGIGTLIFIIIGMALMGGVIIIMLIRRPKDNIF